MGQYKQGPLAYYSPFKVPDYKEGDSPNMFWLGAYAPVMLVSNGVSVRCPDAYAKDGLQLGLLIEKPSALLQRRVYFFLFLPPEAEMGRH